MSIPGSEQFFSFRKELLKYIQDSFLSKFSDSKVQERFYELIDYTTDGGKCLRGLLTAYGYLEAIGADPNSEEAKPGYALGWAQEILQASFLVADDFMDRTPLRRGKPCWYVKDDNNFCAVSDSYFLENLVYLVIDHYLFDFSAETKREVKNLFWFTTFKTAFGQFIDMTPKDPTIENWNLMVENKTSYYSIWAPFVTGLCASQKIPKEVWNSDALREILLRAGKLFQCQDDWIDIYGTSAKIGKVGSDIQEGKVTWLFAKAMEIGNEQQKKLLMENNGHKEQEKVDTVKQIYSDLHIEEICLHHQEQEYENVKKLLENADSRIPKKLIEYLLSCLNHRKF